MAWKNLKHIPADDKKLKYGSVEVYSPVFLKDYTDLRIQNTLPKNPPQIPRKDHIHSKNETLFCRWSSTSSHKLR